MTLSRSVLAPTGLDVRTDTNKPPSLRVPQLKDIASATSWLTTHRDAIRTELLRHGHLMIRGLPITDSDEFAALRDVLVTQRASYREKATPRSEYGNDIFSSTDFPADQSIRLHNENSYTLEFPGLLLFCCLDAPTEGGATTVADVRRVLAGIPDELLERFRACGWQVTRNFHDYVGLPWQTAFATDSREAVEQYCRANLVGCTWTDDGLRTVQRRSAVVRHPVTGEKVWFNHVAFWSPWSLSAEDRDILTDAYGSDGMPFSTAFGDGTALSESDVAVLNSAYEAAACRENWQPGDVLLVDNVLSAHGRDAFTGNRKVLVAMGEPVQLSDCAPTVQPSPGPESVES